MSFFNIFKNFFGGGTSDRTGHHEFEDFGQNRDGFRNPIWQTDEDDDDDDFRRPHSGIQFNIFSDPMEITRFFEAQMDSMLKSFVYGFGDSAPFNNGSMNALPFPEPKKNSDLRDEVLKPGYELPSPEGNGQRVDKDLDGKVGVDEFSQLWKDPKSQKAVEPYTPSFGHKFGKSVMTNIVRMSDGTIENRRVVRDSEGNEETTVTRQVGDKKYVVTTRKDKNGTETRNEELINMDEKELKDFNQKWTPPVTKPDTNGGSGTLNEFPWEKFFGPSPKL